MKGNTQDILSKTQKAKLTEDFIKRSLAEAPEATIEIWLEGLESRSDLEVVAAIEALFIGDYLARTSIENAAKAQTPKKGIKADIIKSIEAIDSKKVLKLIQGFIDIATKGIISRKCKKSGDPFYSYEYSILEVYEEALKLNDESSLYEITRLCKNLRR